MEEERDLQVGETDEEGEGMLRLRRDKNRRKRWVGSGGSECHLIDCLVKIFECGIEGEEGTVVVVWEGSMEKWI